MTPPPSNLSVVVPRIAPTHCGCCAGRNPLSRRQQQVIDRLVEGDTTTEIADGLGISEHTVFNHHLTAINDVLGTESRYEAVSVCLAAGWCTRCLTAHPASEEAGSDRVALTYRQRALLPLIGAGRSYARIGGSPAATHRSVSKQIRRIKTVFGARTRCHLIALLHDFGYVPGPHPDPDGNRTLQPQPQHATDLD